MEVADLQEWRDVATWGLEVTQQFTVGNSTQTCSLYKVIDLQQCFQLSLSYSLILETCMFSRLWFEDAYGFTQKNF